MEKQIEEKCPCQTDTQSCCACVSMHCHECIKPKLSKFVQGRFCSNCGRPLRNDVVQRYRKASEVAEEILAEIENLMNEVYSSVQYGCYSYGMTKQTDSPAAQRQCGKLEGVKYLGDKIAELKKKFTKTEGGK